MATIPKPRINLAALLGKRGYEAELKKLREFDATRRERDKARILGTDTIAEGDIDAARLLMTTLGGKPRPITLDDLRQFTYNAQKLGRRFKGGITARGVIEHSLQVDRDRSNREIRTAVVQQAKAGVLRFITNSGPDSDVARHFVHVEFPAFKAFASSPRKPDTLVRPMLAGPLKFECDCGRFTFWYRYLATKGGFVHGRVETGFPRIRNPKLVGVACKHALRVMQAIETDATVRVQATKMIAAGQRNEFGPITATAAQARAEAERQLATSHHARNKVETKAQQELRRSSTTAGKLRALRAAEAEAQRRAKAESEKGRKAMADLQRKLASMPLTKAQRDELIRALQSAPTAD